MQIAKYIASSILSVLLSVALLSALGVSWWTVSGWLIWLPLTWLLFYSYIRLEAKIREIKKPSALISITPPVVTWILMNMCFAWLVNNSLDVKEMYVNFSKPFGHAPTTDMELITSIMANKKLVIPKAYAWHYKSQVNGHKDRVMLEVLYPDMEPYSVKNRGEFYGTGWSRRIKLTIVDADSPESVMRRFDNVYNNDYKDQPSGSYNDLTIYTRKEESDDGFGAELYVLNDRYNPDYYLVCDKSDGYKFPPNPSCESSIFIEEGFIIKYTYSRNYMKDWKNINRGIKSLTRSFTH